jgi:hypothetical protein
MSTHGDSPNSNALNEATDIAQDEGCMSNRAIPTPELQGEYTSSESSSSIPQPRSKTYVTASDSEGVAADVAKYGGDRLYVAALSSFGDDNSDEDDDEGDVDSGEDSEDEEPEDKIAGNESGSDGAEASEDEDEDLESG